MVKLEILVFSLLIFGAHAQSNYPATAPINVDYSTTNAAIVTSVSDSTPIDDVICEPFTRFEITQGPSEKEIKGVFDKKCLSGLLKQDEDIEWEYNGYYSEEDLSSKTSGSILTVGCNSPLLDAGTCRVFTVKAAQVSDPKKEKSVIGKKAFEVCSRCGCCVDADEKSSTTATSSFSGAGPDS